MTSVGLKPTKEIKGSEFFLVSCHLDSFVVFSGISSFPVPVETSWCRKKGLIKGCHQFFKISEKVERKVVGCGEQKGWFVLTPFKYLPSFE